MIHLSVFSCKGNNPARSSVVLPLLLLAMVQICRAEPEVSPGVSGDSIAREIQEVFNDARQAICKIKAEDRHGRLSGTGFFIDTSGTIMTAYSIGGGTQGITVETGGKVYQARRLLADSRSGIALLKIDADTDFLPLGNSDEAILATPVLAIGYPMDLELSHSFGTISGFDLRYLGRYFSTTHLRAGVPVMRGQGGGPMLDMDGKVLGILISSIDGGAGCHALPINSAKKIYSDYVQYGEPRHGWIGVTVERANTETARSTAVICEIESKAPAAQAGLRNGDVLLSIGEHLIAKPEDVLDASFFLTAGDTVEMRVLRDGEELALPVSAAEHPSSPTLQAHTPTMTIGDPEQTLELDN